MISSSEMWVKPRFSGTNLINKAFLTADIALLKLDLDVRNKVERITFESPVFILQKKMATEVVRLLADVFLIKPSTESQSSRKFALVIPNKLL